MNNLLMVMKDWTMGEVIKLDKYRKKEIRIRDLTPEEVAHTVELRRLAIIEVRTGGGKYYDILSVAGAMIKQYRQSRNYLKLCRWSILIIWHHCYIHFKQKKFERVEAKFDLVTGTVFLNEAEIKLLKL